MRGFGGCRSACRPSTRRTGAGGPVLANAGEVPDAWEALAFVRRRYSGPWWSRRSRSFQGATTQLRPAAHAQLGIRRCRRLLRAGPGAPRQALGRTDLLAASRDQLRRGRHPARCCCCACSLFETEQAVATPTRSSSTTIGHVSVVGCATCSRCPTGRGPARTARVCTGTQAVMSITGQGDAGVPPAGERAASEHVWWLEL
jgi:hypothetical protein